MKPKLNSLLNTTWKVALTLIGFAAVLLLVERTANFIDFNFGRRDWADQNLSDRITVRYFKRGGVRVYDEAAGKYLTGKVRWVSGRPYRDSLTVYCDKRGNRGYLNCNTGKIAIPAGDARFKHAWQFSEGYAFVVAGNKDSLSIIDHSGSVVARNVALRRAGYDYVFVGGVCKVPDGEGLREGFLRTDGTWAVEPKYFDIDYANTDGYRIARNEEGYWLIDMDFRLVFSEPYEMIDFAVGDMDAHLYLTKSHVKVLATYDGKVVEPFVIDGTYSLYYLTKYSEEEANEYSIDPDVVVYQVNGWEGLMDKHSGRILTPANYTNFTMISKELIRAELDQGCEDNAVVMDRRGICIKTKKMH